MGHRTGNKDFSIVEYVAGHSGYSCGYCKSSDTNFSHGMWAHLLTVDDYQALIDRGWRRSGKYCYKPTLARTCCPQYTIRCDVLQIKLSKSQKTVMKKMNKYLNLDLYKPEKISDSSINDLTDEESADNVDEGSMTFMAKSAEEKISLHKIPSTIRSHEKCWESNEEIKSFDSELRIGKTPKPGGGPDPSRPPCKKAKLLRMEKREQKSDQNVALPRKKCNDIKLVEDYLNEVNLESGAHKLEIRLVQSSPESAEFTETFGESYDLYNQYQQIVHKDPPKKCTKSQFRRFLVESPLKVKLVRSHPKSPEFESSQAESYLVYKKYQMEIHNDDEFECDDQAYNNFLVASPLQHESTSNGPGYGSFHQQYWLDGKLIAVGVLDVLPQCVSSVYFYYDPDYRFLSLGTYASLREIAFTRELQKVTPELQFYYMGFYIHSCPKMRYKGQYQPSFLLCPETYSWHTIEKSSSKLDRSKYSRFEEDINKSDEDVTDINSVTVLFDDTKMSYHEYLKRNRRQRPEADVTQYAGLVGGQCAQKMLLYRHT